MFLSGKRLREVRLLEDMTDTLPAAWWFSPQQLEDPAVSGDEADPDDDGPFSLLRVRVVSP